MECLRLIPAPQSTTQHISARPRRLEKKLGEQHLDPTVGHLHLIKVVGHICYCSVRYEGLLRCSWWQRETSNWVGQPACLGGYFIAKQTNTNQARKTQPNIVYACAVLSTFCVVQIYYLPAGTLAPLLWKGSSGCCAEIDQQRSIQM